MIPGLHGINRLMCGIIGASARNVLAEPVQEFPPPVDSR